MDPADQPDSSNLVASSLSSPSTEEATAYPDFISSYTQISHRNNAADAPDDQTDIEDSSDELESEFDETNNNNNNNDKSANTNLEGTATSIPQLSSQIIEWSNERFQVYDGDNSRQNFDAKLQSGWTLAENQKRQKSKKVSGKNKLYFVHMNLLRNIEAHAMKLSQNVNTIMKFIRNASQNMTSASVQSIEGFESSLQETCESVDLNIKLMYKIIANCDELNRSLGFVETLAAKIREVKQTLDLFERLIEKN